MEQWNINPNLPFLRPLTNSRREKRRLSCSQGSMSAHSSSRLSTTQSKKIISIPTLIELCIYPDENYACQTMKTLLSSRYHYSPNVYDEFGCNVLMYTLRYQRYQLFDFLLNEATLDIDLRSKDRHGNTILHYAVIYGKNDTQIIEILIENFKKFGIDVDERNILGFTPLLLAMFCGRYDIVLVLLSKTDASPFVRDYIRLKNMLDYIETDAKHKKFLDTIKKSRQYSQYSYMNRDMIRFSIQLYKTLPLKSETSCQASQQHCSMNFFEHVLAQAVQDRSGLIRLSILKVLHTKYDSSDLIPLVQYINQRYPHIRTQMNTENSETATLKKIDFQFENSKTNIHDIFNLFDPSLRPKATPPEVLPTEQSQLSSISPKLPNTFKRLSTKLTVLAALSRSQTINRTLESLKPFGNK